MTAEQIRQVESFIGQGESKMEIQQAQAIVQMVFECHARLEELLQKNWPVADEKWKKHFMQKFSEVN